MARVLYTGPTPASPSPFGSALRGLADAGNVITEHVTERRKKEAFSKLTPQQLATMFQSDPTALASVLDDPEQLGMVLDALGQGTQEPFSLSPGETRFAGDGTPIASVPETPPEISRLVELADQARQAGEERRAQLLERRAESLAGKTLDQIRAEARARELGKASVVPRVQPVQTLSPEQATGLGFPEGSVVQQKPDGSLAVVFEPAADKTVRSRRLAELMDRGMSREKATDIVDGNIRIEIVPATGRARLINEVTNAVEEIPIGGMSEGGEVNVGRPEIPADQTLYGMAEDATGMRSSAKALIGQTVGQVFPSAVDEDVEAARTTLKSAANELIRTLSINPRFPVAEMERLLEETNMRPDAMDSPEALRARMVALNEFLKSRLEIAQRDANDPSLPEETRSTQAQTASYIANFLPRLGVPDTAGQLPVGLPEGSQKIGTTESGLPVYEAPDGKRFVVE